MNSWDDSVVSLLCFGTLVLVPLAVGYHWLRSMLALRDAKIARLRDDLLQVVSRLTRLEATINDTDDIVGQRAVGRRAMPPAELEARSNVPSGAPRDAAPEPSREERGASEPAAAAGQADRAPDLDAGDPPIATDPPAPPTPFDADGADRVAATAGTESGDAASQSAAQNTGRDEPSSEGRARDPLGLRGGKGRYPAGGLSVSTAGAAHDQPPPPPPTRIGLEERLGARLPVWLGSIALAMAGVFLVRYSIDQGWITETLRVMLGVMLGIGMLGAGEWLGTRAESIAAGVSAAGIAVLYAAFLAASELYHLVPSTVGFALTALVTATAVALSLRRGPIVAIIGLIGGLLTPQLLRGGTDAHPGLILAYLLVLQAGLLAVSKQRDWWWLAAAGLLPALAWVLPWFDQASDPSLRLVIHGYLLMSLALYVAVLLRSQTSSLAADDRAADRSPDRALEQALSVPLPRLILWAALISTVVLSSSMASVAEFTNLDWGELWVIGAGSIVLGARLEGSIGLPWLTALIIGTSVAGWADAGSSASGPSIARTLWVTLSFGLLFGAGAYGAMQRTRPAWPWAALCSVSSVGFLLMGFFATQVRLPGGPLGLPWGGWFLLLGALLTLGAVPVAARWNREAQEPGPDSVLGWNRPLAALAAGATACAALAVPIELALQWITVAWALEVAALAWLARRLRVPALRLLIWPLMVFVAVRLLANPAILSAYPTGEMPILNWILYGYGAPIAAFAYAAYAVRNDADEPLAQVLEVLAMLLGGVLITLQIMHWFGEGTLWHTTTWMEATLIPIAWTLYGLGLRYVERYVSLRSLRLGGLLFALAGLGVGVFLQLGPWNPIWSGHAVGDTIVFNGLLLAYAVPALLALVLARDIARSPDMSDRKELLIGLGIIAVVMGFVWINWEVRHLFHGSQLSGPTSSSVEPIAYTVAWVLYGLVLLAIGLLRGSLTARRASLAMLMLAFAKAALYDTRQLDELARILSFLLLGVSLLFLAWIYQRFVFHSDREAGS